MTCASLQFTSVNGVDSSHAKITCGVPQESVLGPLLFLLYINDISNAVRRVKVRLFADDTNLFISSRSA
jgi:ribonucleases P/MRP protein subunit RPP40